MRIDGKIAAGYVLLCDCGNAFALPRISVGVECPACGHTALGVDVALEYYLARGRQRLAADSGSLESLSTG